MNQGDVLLIQAKLDPLAWLIRLGTKSEWNHVAWAVDNHYLIEARGHGIFIVPITKYLKWQYKVKLIRLKQPTKPQLKEGVRYASQFKGKRSYLKYLKAVLKIFFFQNDAFILTTTCSNLISKGMDMAGYHFIHPHLKKVTLITPEDISKCASRNVSNELKLMSR